MGSIRALVKVQQLPLPSAELPEPTDLPSQPAEPLQRCAQTDNSSPLQHLFEQDFGKALPDWGQPLWTADCPDKGGLPGPDRILAQCPHTALSRGSPVQTLSFYVRHFQIPFSLPRHPLPGFIHQPVPGVLITLKGSPRPGGPLCEFLSHDSQILSRAGLASSGQTGSALDWHLNTAGKSSGLCDMCSEQQGAQLGRTGSTIPPREPNPPPARDSYPQKPHKRLFAHPALAR